MKAIKEQLLITCRNWATDKLQTIEEIIASHQKSLASETKSSAGDKHETGRAMVQLEMEKAGQQLQEVNTMQIILSKITFDTDTIRVKLGSVVITNTANYFIAISAGKITIDDQQFYAISSNSPIGKLLLGQQSSTSIRFNGNTIVIKEIW